MTQNIFPAQDLKGKRPYIAPRVSVANTDPKSKINYATSESTTAYGAAFNPVS